jgi:hypothetical protein
MVGSARSDRLAGTTGADVIAGGGGADRINGKGGNDVICGGGGRDRLIGAIGDDRLLGGAGKDRCEGGQGSNSFSSCEVNDRNRPPTTGDVSVTTSEDQAKSIDLTAAANDPDSESLVIASLDTEGLIGGLSADDSRQVRFDPDGRFESLGAGQSTSTSFRFTLADGRGGTATGAAIVTVEGVDDSPVAAADTASVTQGDAPTSIDVLANDTDVDGGPRQIASTTPPAHGSVEIGTGGSTLTYESSAGYCNDDEAADQFTYTLDGGSTATVSVTVACVTVVSTSAELEPAFSPSISDYVVHCDGEELGVSGRTAAGTSVSIDGQPSASGQFDTSVDLEENQEFEFTLDDGSGGGAPYFVRCLPSDFPVWEYEGLQPTSHQYYVTAPTLLSGIAPPYAVIFDDNGVPVWWYANRPAGPIDVKVLKSGTVAWWSQSDVSNGYEIRELDGDLVRTVEIVDGSTDIHELQQQPNGNFLVTSYMPREHADLEQFGGSADQSVIDGVVEEIGPSGELVWKWSTEGHVDLSETGRWWPTALASNPADIVHMNAVEPIGNDAILISLRHTDAVYKVDKATGDVIWKLGGTWTPKSLDIVGDPEGAYPLGGQHDMRLQADGTITIHDNNTNQPFPPRAVRYQIDETAHTATMVEQVTDPLVPSSFCCGSARLSADGSWLFSWGGRSLVTEFNAAGERTFKLSFVPDGIETGIPVFSYRAVAAPDGILAAAALRDGMDSMHPR